MADGRKLTRQVKAGSLSIGGAAPVSVQSMCNTDTRDVSATIRQIAALEDSGCQLVRLAVPDMEAALSLERIVKSSHVPLCADIHFDHRLALTAMEAGVSKVRINPGNIGSDAKVNEVVKAAALKGIPIRIGVNSGSLQPALVAKYGRTARALAESALAELLVFERLGFYDTVLSVKSTDVSETVEANRIISGKVGYPIHLGLTEAGPPDTGVIRSSAAIGALLLEGIGDTIRISLTADPVLEVKAGRELLKGLGLMKGLKIVSCPTCGRTRGDVTGLVEKVREGLRNADPNVTVAIMGCEVNGPGEAADADFGLACGQGAAIIFRKGAVVGRVPYEEAAKALLEMILLVAPGADDR
ncbi:MAG TPA: flavodoxin-dependent (E)-4-hydroxy-3-methylbut-2-enyl-diphosphate synthase [Bacillota bacterium]|nr:flavodoxin-dependent (E)-4-hydroxy-3-methylbut-2-enyl-diphosphate synthase [Bacillota bacterium]